MWAKLLQAVLIPWIEKSVVALYKWALAAYKEWQRKRELKKINNKKTKNFKEADNEKDITDSYSDLP
jgi:hypothetical protein